MGKPQFKNSSMRLNSDIAITDKVSVSFWFNIDDEKLVEQLERYYVMTGNKPNLQYQRKDGDQYTTVATSNLFIPDERAAELRASTTPKEEEPSQQNSITQEEDPGLPEKIDGDSYNGFPGSN
tara:strand:+ start:426 stop:794 length:369 start_codon:yes stop_codon:yes gene_type:complete